jgi:N-acetylglutamate synthase
MTLSPTDIGRRVVIRRRLAAESAASGRPIYGDVLGILESWTDGTILVRRSDGEVIAIADQDVVAGKPIPPAPQRRTGRPGPTGRTRPTTGPTSEPEA